MLQICPPLHIIPTAAQTMCLVTKLVSEQLESPKSNLSMTYPRPYVLNTEPKPLNCMPMPGPHSQ